MKFVELEPGDILVLKMDKAPRDEALAAIREGFNILAPGQKVIVMDKEMNLETLRTLSKPDVSALYKALVAVMEAEIYKDET